jgi:murein DD-endopeptidase MepM/ murein hydrolase activator NlpD
MPFNILKGMKAWLKTARRKLKMPQKKFFLGLTAGMAVAALALFFWPRTTAIVTSFEESQREVVEEFPFQIKKNSNLYDSLREVGMSPLDIHNLAKAAKPQTNLSRVRPGMQFQVSYGPEPEQEVIGLLFRFSPTEYLEAHKAVDGWEVKKIVEPVDVKLVTYSGVVTSSLWESAQDANMDPNLIAELAEIFAWQVDFAREVRENDKWRLSVEQLFVKGKPIGWGSIIAAEYQNQGDTHVAALFRKEGKDIGYFTPDGDSLRRMFLKSPLRFGRISSRFTKNRFHPILKIGKAHLGVDYAAPVGTPVRAVGDGSVTFVGYSGGGGKVIKVRHNSIYQTAYKHLSGYAKGVVSGARVRQGQVIGYVGATGLATGPHLHFEFYQAGRFVDPLGRRFPSADPVAKNQLKEFKTLAATELETLPAWAESGVALGDTSSSDGI